MTLRRPLLTFLAVCFLPLVASAVPAAEEQLHGTWRDAERKSLIDFSKQDNGTWTGKIIQAVHKEEVGRTVFLKLVYDTKTKSFTGLIIRPDVGNDGGMDVTLTLISETAAQAFVRKFIFSKTISLTKEVVPSEDKK